MVERLEPQQLQGTKSGGVEQKVTKGTKVFRLNCELL
jgi:hypothetical protein